MPTTVSTRAHAVALLLLVPLAGLAGCADDGPRPGAIRIGHFPNLTHAQALYGFESGLFEDRLQGMSIERSVFNAGPTAYDALLAGSVDVIYVGPAPTLNVLRATGSGHLRVIAGAAEGGAFLILRPGVDVDGPADLAGLRLAAPQLGNTQDVALRHWLQRQGHRTRDLGGDVDVVDTSSADILGMLKRGRGLDGAWVPEPWATRIVREAGGVVLVDEAKEPGLWPDGRFVTTHLVTTTAFMESHPRELARFVAAHEEATRILASLAPEGRTPPANAAPRLAGDASSGAQGLIDRDTVLRTLNAGLVAAGGVPLEEDVLVAALGNITFTTDPNREALAHLLGMVEELGFGRGTVDLRSAVDPRFLGEHLGPDGEPMGTGGGGGLDAVEDTTDWGATADGTTGGTTSETTGGTTAATGATTGPAEGDGSEGGP